MTKYKTLLFSATAAAALLGAASTSFAFEEVDWTWDANVDEYVSINVDVDTNVDPTGLVQVEKLQIHFGDLNANSNIDGVYNNAALDGTSAGGTIPINQTFDFSTTYNPSADPQTINPTGGTGSTGPLTASLLTGGNVNEGPDSLNFQVQVNGLITVPSGTATALNADDLPKVEGAATAVANNQSITSDVPLYLHDGQFAAGGFNSVCDEGGDGCTALATVIGSAGLFSVDQDLEDLNEHTTIAGLLTVGAATGLINPASIRADARVSNILNAYVDNTATALTNNASYTIESDVSDNHVMVADLTQWGYANISANASVNNVSLNGYTGFGEAGLGGIGDDLVPVVSNKATAVGNNLSISVGNISTDSDD